MEREALQEARGKEEPTDHVERISVISFVMTGGTGIANSSDHLWAVTDESEVEITDSANVQNLLVLPTCVTNCNNNG